MKKKFKILISTILLIFLGYKLYLYIDLFITTYGESSTKINENFIEEERNFTTINIQKQINSIKQKYLYLEDMEDSELGYLAKAEWNYSGTGIIIYCLNDVAEYEGGKIFELYFEDSIFEEYKKGKSLSYMVDDFIEKINDKLNNTRVLLKYEVKDLILTLDFNDGSPYSKIKHTDSINFTVFYEGVVNSLKYDIN